MKAKQIYKIANEIWLPELSRRGFEQKNGSYLRVLNSGVVHHIAIDKDPHGADTFRLLCGVDSVPIREETKTDFGFVKRDELYHLTPKGWDNNSGRWPCETEEESRASVHTLFPLICDLAIPYFAPITTLTDVGNEINELRRPQLLWVKARLLMLDGNIKGAQDSINKYEAYVTSARPWISQKHVEGEIARLTQVREALDDAARELG